METKWLAMTKATNNCTDRTQPHKAMLMELLLEGLRSKLASARTSSGSPRLCKPVGTRWETVEARTDSKRRLRPLACSLAKQTSKS